MQDSLKYLLLSDVLSAMEAQHQAYGIDKHLQIQELWRKLPDDLPLEEYKTFLVPVLATNKQEQKYLYQLFEESLKRVSAFEKTEAKPAETKVDEVAWWKNVIAALVVGLLLFLAYQAYKYLNPVIEHKTERYPVSVEQNTERVIQLSLRTDTLSDISFTNGQKVGDTTFAHYYIDPDSYEFHIEAKDTFSRSSFEVCLRFVYSQPPIDTICYDITVFESKKEEEKPEYAELEEQELPYPHKIEQLSVNQDQLARADYWRKNAWWIKTLLILLVGAILWAIIKWREKRDRQLIAEIESKDQAPYVWNIELEEDKRLSLNESFMLALRRLRKRREEEIYHLDVAQTVDATIKNAGLVNFQYSQATRPPEYLLLIDRKNRNDHRAALFDQISQTFKDNDVLVERYFFDGDVRTCYNKKHPWGIGLKDLQHLYHNSRLLIVSDGYRLLNPMNGKLARWTKIFNSWKHTAILSPLPLDKWGRKEQQLRQLFQVMPNSIQGLKATLEQFDSLEAKDQETVLGQIEDAPKAPITVQGNIIETLQKTFKREPKLVDWVAACAVYPSLHWDLTLHFGKTLSTEDHQLLSLENLQELTRLPWFVEGKFPDAVREELLVYLKNTGQDNFFRKTLHEALDKAPKPEENSVASEEYRMNVVLNEWLFTKDKAKKKELEEEFARYLAAGNDPDFVVFKYLDRESSILDTPIPDSWRQYISGEQLSVWRSEIWPWALLAWSVFTGFTIFYSPKFDLCPEDVVEYRGQTLCLDKPWKKVAHLEFLTLDQIYAGKPEAADQLMIDNGGFLSTNKYEADTFYRNVAMGFYNQGAKLHNEFYEFEAENEENIVLPDSICRYFEYASSTDSLSALAKDMSVYSAVKGNMIIYQGLAKCRGEEDLNIPQFIAENKNRAIYEMNKGKVPASVILAQMLRCYLLNGESIISETNNPLCIRCKNRNQVNDSCYEVYSNQEEAFQDYKEITDGLFIRPNEDYKSWVRTIANSGYSSEVNYEQTLIRILERYDLSQYDEANANSTIETVQVGDQTWTAKNLNIVTPNSWCYDDDPDYCEQYGRLYTQEAAQLACQSLGEGWRLPRAEEWLYVISRFGGYYDWESGENIGSPSASYADLIEGGNSGLNLTIAGFKMEEYSFRNLAANGNYWTSENRTENTGWNINLNLEEQIVTLAYNPPEWGFSCRCVKRGEGSSSIQQRPEQTELEIFTQAGRVGLRDQEGRMVVKPIYNNIELDSTSQLYRVQAATRGGLQMGYINRTGRVVIPIEYQSLGFLQDGLILAGKNRFGYLDAFGNVVIDFEYEQATDFKGGVAQVMKRNGNQVSEYSINTNGNCVENCPEVVVSSRNGIFYVKEGQVGNGTSWDNSTGNLQAVLKTARSGDQIWVAAGTYYPTADGNREIAFEIPNGVKMYGGFTGNERQLNSRDWNRNRTTLSGSIGGSAADDNSYTVVITRGVSRNTIIDGFRIVGGNANAQTTDTNPTTCGGGWFNDGSERESNPTIMNCYFARNLANNGAAFYNYGFTKANTFFEGCDFVSNKAIFDGGAVYNDGRTGEANPEFGNCTFISNQANYGGAILNNCGSRGASPVISNCTFSKNQAIIIGNSIHPIKTGKTPCEAILKGNIFDDDPNEDSSVIDPRDGQIYRTVTIGNQTWLAQNMNITLENSWCYDNDPKNCETYGRLYNWEAAKQACDGLGDGWHLPSDKEWDTLVDSYGGKDEAYQSLIEGGESKFRALLGGFRYSAGKFAGLTEHGPYWSATESAVRNALYFRFHSGDIRIYRNTVEKLDAHSCRCVKD
jgi:uncharacterized protein (TIGR02145 family)